jgi:hypothetical protein
MLWAGDWSFDDFPEKELKDKWIILNEVISFVRVDNFKSMLLLNIEFWRCPIGFESGIGYSGKLRKREHYEQYRDLQRLDFKTDIELPS